MDNNTVIIQCTPPNQNQISKKGKQKLDIIDMTFIFSSTKKVDISPQKDSGVIKYEDLSTFIEQDKIDEKIQSQGPINIKSSLIYYTIIERSIQGELLNKENYKNQNKIRYLQDLNKSYGIHIAISSLQFGEKGIFLVKSEYRKMTLEQLQMNPNARVVQFVTESQLQTVNNDDVVWIIEVISYENPKKQPSELNFEERKQIIDSLNDAAKQDFSKGNYEDSGKKYKSIRTYSTQIPKALSTQMNNDEKEYLKGQTIKSLTNEAVCNLKKQKWNIVSENAKEAIKLNEKSVKAHMLLGKSYFEREMFKESKQQFKLMLIELKELLTTEEKNEILSYWNKMKTQKEKCREKQIYEHMINNLSAYDREEDLKKKKEKFYKVQQQKVENKIVDDVLQGKSMNQEELMKLHQ